MFATVRYTCPSGGREPLFEISFANGESYPISTRCLIDLSEEIDYALDDDDEGEGNFLENLANAREIDDEKPSPLPIPVFVNGEPA